jgi:hypothetical protein
MQISSIQSLNQQLKKQPVFQRRQVFEENGQKFVKIPKKEYDFNNIVEGIFLGGLILSDFFSFGFKSAKR